MLHKLKKKLIFCCLWKFYISFFTNTCKNTCTEGIKNGFGEPQSYWFKLMNNSRVSLVKFNLNILCLCKLFLMLENKFKVI